jgi:hypothetical protein
VCVGRCEESEMRFEPRNAIFGPGSLEGRRGHELAVSRALYFVLASLTSCDSIELPHSHVSLVL